MASKARSALALALALGVSASSDWAPASPLHGSGPFPLPDLDDGLVHRITTVQNSQDTGTDPGIYEPEIENSGRFAVFHTRSGNLSPNVIPGVDNVYVVDLARRVPRPVLVTMGYDGQPANGDSYDPVVHRGQDAEGRKATTIAFVSAADNLVPDDHNGIPDVFVYDRIAGRTVRVSIDSEGNEGTYEGELESICHTDVSVSDDGRFVAFVAFPALAEEDTNSFADIYVHDRDHDEDGIFDERDPGSFRTFLVSRSERGESLNSHCGRPYLSGDGEKIAWVSHATNVLPDSMPPDPNDDIDGFCTDLGELRRTGGICTILITQAMDGGWQNIGGCTPSVSRDGRYVSFTSHSTNLAPNTGPVTQPPPRERDVPLKAFVRDMWRTDPGKIVHLSRSRADGGPPNGNCYRTILHDGVRLFVTFTSEATDLVEEDTDDLRDVVVSKVLRDDAGEVRRIDNFLISRRFPEGEKSDGVSNDPTVTSRANVVGVLYTSRASNLAGDDGPPASGYFDLYYAVKRLN